MHNLKNPPVPGPEAGRGALKALLKSRNILTALEEIHAEMGNVFQMPLPGFKPVFLVGPEANRFVTVTGREDLRWRSEGDPVTHLLRQGILVTDGSFHDELRRQMLPPLHKGMLANYVEIMWQRTDQVMQTWRPANQLDMLVEMRRVALLILMDALFRVDATPDLKEIWPAILRTLSYISPGAWLVIPGLPRPGYGKALQTMDTYLYRLITDRRVNPGSQDDLLGALVAAPGMSDGLIRDQLLTMLIAGHDTSTALLAWTLYQLVEHPDILDRVVREIDTEIGCEPPTIENVARLEYLQKVLNETLRLYPPIHIGNRIAAQDLEFQGYRIPAGTRVVYSIYLTHRMPEYWPEPHRFDPERFSPERAQDRPHYTYLPFGGGPRNCIGLAFAQVEVKVVLARLLQTFAIQPPPGKSKAQVHPHMGATLEPRPGVPIQVTRR